MVTGNNAAPVVLAGTTQRKVRVLGLGRPPTDRQAEVAQLGERRFRKPRVGGSSPSLSSGGSAGAGKAGQRMEELFVTSRHIGTPPMWGRRPDVMTTSSGAVFVNRRAYATEEFEMMCRNWLAWWESERVKREE